ncbi:hypothetical protein RP726_18850 [Candidatus Methylospira mobilis]|uniref:c-type cytochrome n=1 Tax=Candidatus Methylospira mobilis TaxID=1808979 RepID=UPI0028E46D0B|nr:hypothetical protein [Candidatus Methylospira mobilis]WNV04433.1 hypothetical protein RP726_18850 [Candidatus Methylospira mobilis]
MSDIETKHLLFCSVLLLPVLAGAATQESVHAPADAAALTLACSGCHGTQTGVSGLPRLDGMEAPVFIQRMIDFKSGKRVSSIMNRIARGYDESELQKMADYLSRQTPVSP